MKFRCFVYLISLLVCYNTIKAQISNPCGVIAGIFPKAADSVVPAGTIINFTSTSINDTSVVWLLDGFYTGLTTPSWNYQITTGVHRISLVAYRGNCSDTTTVVYFSAGSAHNIDTMMIANYGHWDDTEYGTCIDKTPEGGLIIGGYNYNQSGILLKLRQRGCIDWSKKIGFSFGGIKVTNVYTSKDSGYYVVGDYGYPFLMKIDKNGNLVWNHQWDILGINYPVVFPKIVPFQMSEDSSGAVYVTGAGYDQGITVEKIDVSGNMVWAKYLRMGTYNVFNPLGNDGVYASGLICSGNKVFITGFIDLKAPVENYNFIASLDAATGNTVWNYGYSDESVGIHRTSMTFSKPTLYDSLIMVAGASNGQWVTLIDKQGNVKKSIKATFTTSYIPIQTRAGADSNGKIVVMQNNTLILPLQPGFANYTNFAKFDTSLNSYWGITYSSNPAGGTFGEAVLSTDQSFAAVGSDRGYLDNGTFSGRHIKVIKIDSPVVNSSLSCDYNSSFTLSNENITRINFQWKTDSALTVSPSSFNNIVISDAFLQSRYECPDFIDSCSFLQLTGPASLCSLSDTYTYKLHRNRKCTLSPQWHLPAGVTIINQADSSISLKFATFGVYHISVTLNSCIPVTDSIVVNISSKSHPLDIGTDTTICTGTAISLHAGKDFFSYKWNSGSIDSVLDVTQPGLYWVEVIDSCNNRLRDSITITPFNLPISIGPDRTKCNTDTVHLNGPAGFISYSWSNNYNINFTAQQNVVVFPVSDTAYFLKAEKFPGCFAYDTVRIHVNTSPAISLGPDISFCTGDSAVLNAGNGFAQYQWNYGDTTSKITVYSTGLYTVKGFTKEGCLSYDTLQVINVWPNPVVKLDHNPGLCAGTIRTLKAGNFASYKWQDGTTQSSIDIRQLGTYFVTVKDIHACIGSDTTHVVDLRPVPGKFLPPDTAICSYGQIVLMPLKTFTAYLWNNGQTTAALTITQPGLYWLQATDQNNCIGKDTINVSLKDCLKGLYIPTAFTPNDDGKNDLLKPILFGNLSMYEWTVYNRYGQLVFTTTDINLGWNGLVNGQKQNSGSFVWRCKYQISGEAVQVRSGSVLLIR